MSDVSVCMGGLIQHARRKELGLTANGRFPLQNRTEFAGQLLLSVPPPVEHLVGLGALLFAMETQGKGSTVTEQ